MTEPHHDPELIAKLRKRTEAPLLECKKALFHSGGNIEKALAWIQANFHNRWHHYI
jgi:translation elongation factor EF-Ts